MGRWLGWLIIGGLLMWFLILSTIVPAFVHWLQRVLQVLP